MTALITEAGQLGSLPRLNMSEHYV
jgi:hypothetical protein